MINGNKRETLTFLQDWVIMLHHRGRVRSCLLYYPLLTFLDFFFTVVDPIDMDLWC